MARSSLGLTALNGGELSPELEGRTDLQKYNQGGRVFLNMIVHPEGGAFRRMGTRFVIEAYDSSRRTRVVPFIFSTEQAYVLEFSHQRLRIYRNEGIIVSPDQTFLPAAVNASTEEIELEDHGYYNEQEIRFDSDQSPEDLPDPLLEGVSYFVQLPYEKSFTDADVDFTNNEIDVANHGYTDQQGPFEVVCTEGGPYPGGLRGPGARDGTEYYIRLTGVGDPVNSFALSLTPGGAAVAIADAGGASSSYTLRPKASYKRNKFRVLDAPVGSGGSAIDLTDGGTGIHTILPQPRHATLIQSTQPLEIDVPYTEDEIFDIQYVQSADVLYLVHPNHPPRKLSRVSNTGWRLDDIFFVDGPFMSENRTTTTCSVTYANTIQTATFSSTEGINGGKGFSAQDIGRLLRTNPRSTDLNWTWWIIVSVVDPVTVQVEPQNISNGGSSNNTDWRLGFFRTNDYPRAVGFTEQRLCFGGEVETPETLHMSKTADFETFSPTGQKALNTAATGAPDDQNLLDEVLDDNAIDYAIGSSQVNAILWMVTARNLVIGTAGSIIPVRAQSPTDALTPTNVRLTPSRVSGAGTIQAIAVHDRVIYTSRNKRQLLSLHFSFDADDYVADNLTLLANHIMGLGDDANVGVVELAFQPERQSILWMPRNDGQLLGLTYEPEQQVFAWHRHILGGSFATGIAQVESVCSIPSPSNTYDQVWLVVKRTIDGFPKRYIEFFLPDWRDGDMSLTTTSPAEPEPIYVDCGPIPYVGVATTTISGLDHLIGETVDVMASAGSHPQRTVSKTGEITLQDPHQEVVAGLPYVSDFESMALEIGDPEGASSGKKRRIDHGYLRVYQSIGGKIGGIPDQLDPIPPRTPNDPMDSGPPPYTGILSVSMRNDWGREARVYIRQDQPLPLNVLSINLRVQGGQR